MDKPFQTERSVEISSLLERFGDVIGCNCNDCMFQVNGDDALHGVSVDVRYSPELNPSTLPKKSLSQAPINTWEI